MTSEAASPPELGFRGWEKALMATSLALFLLALALYLADFVFLPQGLSGAGVRIGTIAQASGSVKREAAGADAFDPIGAGEAVYAGDLLVTGPDAKALVDLGTSTLEVEPSSMIRLSFDSGFTFSGITRFIRRAKSMQVNVVAGGVSRRSGKVRLLERGAAAREGEVAVRVPPLPVVPPPPKASAPEVALPPAPEDAPRPVVAPERVEAPPVVAALPSAVPSAEAPKELVGPPFTPPPVAAFKEVKKIRFLEPKSRSRIKVPDGSARAEAIAKAQFLAGPPGIPLQMSLHRLTRLPSGELHREQVFAQDVITGKGPGKVTHPVDAPGEYEWELRAPGGESIASAGTTTQVFTVEPQYMGVNLENPLVGGEESASNRLRGRILRNFDIRLRWKPVPGAESYHIWIGSAPGAAKALFEKNVGKETSLSLNKGRMLKGRLYYRVSARLPKGYVAVSRMSPLIFDFLPPTLVGPAEGESVKRKTLDQRSMVFTWEATNFTEAYLFEISPDPGFEKGVESERVEENFRVGTVPKAGLWYWRVKSLGKDVESGSSKPRSFRID